MQGRGVPLAFLHCLHCIVFFCGGAMEQGCRPAHYCSTWSSAVGFPSEGYLSLKLSHQGLLDLFGVIVVTVVDANVRWNNPAIQRTKIVVYTPEYFVDHMYFEVHWCTVRSEKVIAKNNVQWYL